jgi:uncharacterized membrane protein HdeD (DUF308 family)
VLIFFQDLFYGGFMKEKKQNRIYSIITALLVIVGGILFVVWPGQMIITFTKVIGGAIAFIGVMQLIRNLTADAKNPILLTIAILIMLFGLWVFFYPDAVTRFIPTMLGILLIVHGLDTIMTALAGKNVSLSNWNVLLFMGVLTVVGGILCIVLSGWIRDAGMILLGVFLIYDGFSSLFVTGKVSHAESKYIDSNIIIEDDED